MFHQLRKSVKFLNFKQFPSKSDKKFVNFDNFSRHYKKSAPSRHPNNSNLELRNFATKSDSSKALVIRETNPKAGSSSLRNFASKSDGEVPPNFDYYRRTAAKTDGSKAKLSSYGVLAAMYIGGLYGAKSVVNYFVGSMSASADVLALASIEINLTEIPEGIHRTFKWRGKPLFIWHRTPKDITRERAVDVESLRDPAADVDRCTNPDWLVLIGVCTHLGCVPIAHSGDYGGYYCPCHGSHFDGAGRVRRGPAPRNLAIPPHRYLSDTLLLVG